MQLILYSVVWVLIAYVFNCVLARKLMKPNVQTALFYAATVMLLGVFGEVLIGTVYETLFKVKLWEYRLFPIHGAHTSQYSTFIWALYGFHIYLLHASLNARKARSATFFAVLLGIEALIIETLMNVTYFMMTGGFMFYYLPSDLFHFTSIVAVPIYVVAGYLIPRVIGRMRGNQRSFTVLSCMLVFIFAFLT